MGFLTPLPQFFRLLPWGLPSPLHPRVLVTVDLPLGQQFLDHAVLGLRHMLLDSPSVSMLALLFCRILSFVRSIL